MTQTELWFKENRHFLILAALQIAAILLLVFVVLPVGDRALSLWRDALNPEVVPTEADLGLQIAFWEQTNTKLATQIDSATSVSHKSDSQEGELAAIQSAAASCKVSLITCEVRSLGNRDGASTASFDLQLKGSFHHLGKLIIDLESSPLALAVDRMILEGTESGSSIININLTLISRRGKQP
jgi:hypothetical protein